MSEQRVFKFGSLTFPGGDVVSIPPIAASGNGWVYKPDNLRSRQEIASGKNRSWPRGSGFGPAEVWMQEYFERQIESRDWEIPSAIEMNAKEPILLSSKPDALAVNFYLEPWGWTSLSLELETVRDAYGRTVPPETELRTLEYKLTIHELGLWYLKRVVGDVHAMWPRGTTAYVSQTVEMDESNVRSTVLTWIKDPWGETVEQLRKLPYLNQTRLNELVEPPENLKGLMYNAHPTEYMGDTIITSSGGKLRFYQSGEVEKVMSNDVAWAELNKIFEVYRYLGYDIRISHGYISGVQEEAVKSITIEVPPSEGDNELGHRIHLDVVQGKITFLCGFAQDDERWLHRQTRLAQSHMGQLETDLYTEYKIETQKET